MSLTFHGFLQFLDLSSVSTHVSSLWHFSFFEFSMDFRPLFCKCCLFPVYFLLSFFAPFRMPSRWQSRPPKSHVGPSSRVVAPVSLWVCSGSVHLFLWVSSDREVLKTGSWWPPGRLVLPRQTTRLHPKTSPVISRYFYLNTVGETYPLGVRFTRCTLKSFVVLGACFEFCPFWLVQVLCVSTVSVFRFAPVPVSDPTPIGGSTVDPYHSPTGPR